MFDQLPVARIGVEPRTNPRRFLRRTFVGEVAGDRIPIGRRASGTMLARAGFVHTLSTRTEISTLMRISHRAMEYTGTPVVGTEGPTQTFI